METHWAAFDPALEPFFGIGYNFIVVKGQVGHPVNGAPLHAALLPFFSEKVFFSHQGVKGHIDDPAERVAEYPTKGFELLDDFWLVIPAQSVEHAAGTQHQFVLGFEVSARQKKCILEWLALTPRQEQLQLGPIETKKHQASAQCDIEVRIVLGELEHL